jgi:hypothetical protein
MNTKTNCLGCMAEKGDVQYCPCRGCQEDTAPESPMYIKPGTILYGKYLLGRALKHIDGQ